MQFGGRGGFEAATNMTTAAATTGDDDGDDDECDDHDDASLVLMCIGSVLVLCLHCGHETEADLLHMSRVTNRCIVLVGQSAAGG